MLLVKRREKNRSRFNKESKMEHIEVLGLEVLVKTNKVALVDLYIWLPLLSSKLFTSNLCFMNFSPFSLP